MLRIIKLGGAIITNKAEYESLNLEALEKISSQIKNILVESDFQTKFIIVCGAGSFGHSIAKYLVLFRLKS